MSVHWQKDFKNKMSHPDVVNIYDNMAIVYDKQNNPNKALEYDDKALTIRLSTLGENHPNVVTSYNNLGARHSRLGNTDKALDYWNR